MAVETEKHIAQKDPEREEIQSSPIERIPPEELHPRVGNQVEKIDLLAPAIPDSWRTLITDTMLHGNASVIFRQIVHTDPPKSIEAHFIRDGAERTFEIFVNGDLEGFKQEQLPAGLPLVAEFKDQKTICTAYRKIDPQAGEPIAAEGKILQPGDAILILTKGKKIRWNYTLSKERFPKGGRVTAITIPDVPGGFQIKHGDIIGYIDPVK